MKLPGRVYRAADAMGRYSTTVVDYRNAERLHNERAAACRAAKGANQQDGDTLPERLRPRSRRCDGPCGVGLLEARRRHGHAVRALLPRGGVGPPAAPDESGPVTHERGRAPARRPPLHPRSDRATGNAGADSIPAIARVGERGGAGDPVPDALHRGVRRLEVPACARRRSRSGISKPRSISRRARRDKEIAMPWRTAVIASLCVAGLATAIATPAGAHHSHANYDISMWTVLEGTVKQLVLMAPHSIVYLEVKDGKGTVTVWALEAANQRAIVNNGVKRAGRARGRPGEGSLPPAARRRQRVPARLHHADARRSGARPRRRAGVGLSPIS